MNKFELMTVVLTSDHSKDAKLLLQELILRMDDTGYCYPSVERLCKVLGIRHAKNFKGVEHYLPGLVTIEKRGKKKFYRINTPALEGVTQAEVIAYRGSWKQRQGEVTPAVEGVVTPAVAEVTPASAEVTPAVEGVNITKENTVDTTEESTVPPVADAPVDTPTNSKVREDDEDFEVEWEDEEYYLNSKVTDPADLNDSTTQDPPASAGVTDSDKDEDNIVYLTPGEEQVWPGICERYAVATAEQIAEAKKICSNERVGNIYERAERAFQGLGVGSEW